MKFKIIWVNCPYDKCQEREIIINDINELKELQDCYQKLENLYHKDDAWTISLVVDFNNNTITIYNGYIE